jgi:hypothetical protein
MAGGSVGCNNRADSATLMSARTVGDATRALPVTAANRAAARAAKVLEAVIDRTGDRAILRARSGSGAGKASERAAYGDVAEAALASLVVEKLNHEVIHLNTRKGERGIDLVTYEESTDTLFVWEAKSSLAEGSISTAPAMGRTASGKQMGSNWMNARLGKAGLDQAQASDVQARAVKIDLKAGKAQIWIVDPASGTMKQAGHPIDLDDFLDLQN